MFLKEFPDYQQLKARAETAFQEENGPNPNTPPKERFEWPLVILNAHTQHCYRPDIKGPFSLFTNVTGTSYVSAGSKKVAVPDDCFFLTNRAQHYSLTIDSKDQPVETFNLHLGQNLWEDYLKASNHPSGYLLDNPFTPALNTGLSDFPNLLQRKTPTISQALHQLHHLGSSSSVSELELQEHLAPLLQALLQQKKELTQRLQNLTAAKASARAELFKRISLATDYLLAYPDYASSLDELAQVACLSKFHFLRAFTQIHGSTPHQFLLQHRIGRSLPLLQKTRMTIGEVALQCGYPEISMFSRTFRKVMGCSPALYRKERN
ncbi:helix-turn-helix domain-containing protein [Rufibacter latericius]|uniref:AraC family transcriptional regulator n=1 Tax=Rufibacter latericius TaxID=2487040 RepID=A0A3M9MLB5_9BACT|nr:AraC family transcriptional regulator [Rufibacter latericius]RNI25673.1 AraC family transcriptional regulator [Rufibacter latericius]